METNKDNIVKYSQEALARRILYLKIVQVWVTTSDHFFEKVVAIFQDQQ